MTVRPIPPALSDIVAARRAAFAGRSTAPAADLQPAAGRFLPALAADGVALVAEIKPRSPSEGVLQAAPDLTRLLPVYEAYAAAISVLTEPDYFGGGCELLAEVARRSPRPALCKDFILHPAQIHDARRAGAEAVLLIVKILDDAQLADLHAETRRWNMTPVVEAQTEAELERALRVSPAVILINNRNLETFEISFDTTKRLAPRVPSGIVTITASGIHRRADVEMLLPYCTRFLVGTSLMRAADLAAAFADLTGRQRP
ncbi:MAG: indole-3-glycerol phosphate synthase [Chloracidobacterium sp. CP2_5A]|nr:MAG: indole-3-glycerol phosphate synthase [Chloracidobacterium sp. CP2_5A]